MKTFPIVFFCLFLLACGRKTDEAAVEVPQTSCLSDYVNRPADLLTRERVAALMDMSDPEFTFTGNEESVIWSWPSERTRLVQLGVGSIQIPMDNQIALSDLRVITDESAGEYVARTYRTLNEEEVARRREELLANLRERVERGSMTEEQAQIAAGMADNMTERTREVETIEAVGDLARWVVGDLTLAVAHRDILFLLYVDISSDKSRNREVALALAQNLISLCD